LPVDVALAYARQGFPVFPCNPSNKSPLVKGGFKAATSDPEGIRAMWARHPDAMPAMRTGFVSGVYVVDVDIDKSTGEAVGHETLVTLGLWEDFQTGILARTASGGRHAYFAHPGSGFGNTHGSRKGIGPKVDTRGDGGYVILPGAVTVAGTRYEWLGHSLLEVGVAGLPTLPGSIHRALARDDVPRAEAWAQKALQNELLKVRSATEGARNETLFTAAAALAEVAAGGHLDWGTVRHRLSDAACSAGLEADEVARAIESGWKTGSVKPRGPKSDVRSHASRSLGIDISEDTVALRFTAEYGDRARFDHDVGKWFDWTGDHWRLDATGIVTDRCRRLAREMTEGLEARLCRQARRAIFVSGVERLARHDPAHAVQQDGWDTDPFLLGCPDATVDLKTGKVLSPDARDLITKRCAVAPSDRQDCPRWIAFLAETAGDDPPMTRFLQQVCGYCLTGSTQEHALFFFYGPGGNGKSVFLNTICRIAGDYATVAAMDTFTASQHDRHSTELAMLRGARIVTASETEEGRPWAESRIKALTGGDPITARFMRQDNFTFRPEFKLLIAGNHKPVLRNVDDAARRRFNIIPFTRKPRTPDPELESKLRAEWPGILRWMIDGAIDWQVNGLVRPDAVVVETNAYFETQDTFGQWLEDECTIETGNTYRWEPAADLFQAWKTYADARGEAPGTQKAFGDRMASRGFESSRHTLRGRRQRSWTGINLTKRATGNGFD